MTTLDTIITSTIIKTLYDLTSSLDDLPGRMPQDAQVASTLMHLVAATIQGQGMPLLLMNTMERRGCDRQEAQRITRALTELALRLGAYLGRER